MLNKCAVILTNHLGKHITISDTEKEIYIYGFELFLSTLLSMISITCISLICKSLLYAVLFVLFFYSLRLFCGGYHANTYVRCFIITNLIFISTIIFTKLILLVNLKWIMPILVIISCVIIYYYSPIQNENHSYSKTKYIKFKNISRILSLVYAVIYGFIFLFSKSGDIAVNSAFSYIWVSLMIIIELIRRKGGRENECYQFSNC